MEVLHLSKRYINLCLGFNNIGNIGIKWLIKSKMPMLGQLVLGCFIFYEDKCNLSEEGIKFLCKSNWPKLKLLFLSIILIIQ